jgi:hypothetical protein
MRMTAASCSPVMTKGSGLPGPGDAARLTCDGSLHRREGSPVDQPREAHGVW